MGSSFEDASIHKGTGVAFVGVAYQILLIAWGLAAKIPFQPSRKTTAASSAKTGIGDDLYHLFGGILLQYFNKCAVAFVLDIVFDLDRVDLAVISKYISLLAGVEWYILLVCDLVAACRVNVLQVFDGFSADDRLLQYIRDVFRFYFWVEKLVG